MKRAYISILEVSDAGGRVHGWLPSPNEQTEEPAEGAICWASGEGDEDLLTDAQTRLTAIGFQVVSAAFYNRTPGPNEKAIDATVAERADVDEIQIGASVLRRFDMTQGWVAH